MNQKVISLLKIVFIIIIILVISGIAYWWLSKSSCWLVVDYKYGVKDLCYLNLANEKKDVDICKNIQVYPVRTACYYGIYTEEALKNKDADICKKIDNDLIGCQSKTEGCLKYIEMCYYEVALDAKDDNLCERISNDNIKDMCKRAVEYDKQL